MMDVWSRKCKILRERERERERERAAKGKRKDHISEKKQTKKRTNEGEWCPWDQRMMNKKFKWGDSLLEIRRYYIEKCN